MATERTALPKGLAIALKVGVVAIAIWLLRYYFVERGSEIVSMNETVAEVRRDTFSTKVRWLSDAKTMPAAYDILCGSGRTGLASGKTYLIQGRLREAWGDDRCLEVLAVQERPPLPLLDPDSALMVSGQFDSAATSNSRRTSNSGTTEFLLYGPLFSNAALMDQVKRDRLGNDRLPLEVCGTIPLSEEADEARVSLRAWDQSRGCYEWSRITIREHQEVYGSRIGEF